ALARVFEKAGYPCEFVPPKSSDSERGAPVARLMSSLRGLYRRFLLSRSLRNRFADQHRPGQGDTLLYSVVLGEWNPGGTHRYLEETVAEFLEIGGAKKARPVVYGIPPAYSQDSEWREFL